MASQRIPDRAPRTLIERNNAVANAIQNGRLATGRAVTSLEKACQYFGASHRPAIPAIVCADGDTVSSGGGSTSWTIPVPRVAYDKLATAWVIMGSQVDGLISFQAQADGYDAETIIAPINSNLGPVVDLRVVIEIGNGAASPPDYIDVTWTITNNGADSGSVIPYALGIISHGREGEVVTV